MFFSNLSAQEAASVYDEKKLTSNDVFNSLLKLIYKDLEDLEDLENVGDLLTLVEEHFSLSELDWALDQLIKLKLKKSEFTLEEAFQLLTAKTSGELKGIIEFFQIPYRTNDEKFKHLNPLLSEFELSIDKWLELENTISQFLNNKQDAKKINDCKLLLLLDKLSPYAVCIMDLNQTIKVKRLTQLLIEGKITLDEAREFADTAFAKGAFYELKYKQVDCLKEINWYRVTGDAFECFPENMTINDILELPSDWNINHTSEQSNLVPQR